MRIENRIAALEQVYQRRFSPQAERYTSIAMHELACARRRANGELSSADYRDELQAFAGDAERFDAVATVVESSGSVSWLTEMTKELRQ